MIQFEPLTRLVANMQNGTYTQQVGSRFQTAILTAVLLRAETDRTDFTLPLGAELDAPILLASNTDATVRFENGILKATLSSPRSYAWLRLARKK